MAVRKLILNEQTDTFMQEVKQMEDAIKNYSTYNMVPYKGVQLTWLIEGFGNYENKSKYIRYFLSNGYFVTPIDPDYSWDLSEDDYYVSPVKDVEKFIRYIQDHSQDIE